MKIDSNKFWVILLGGVLICAVAAFVVLGRTPASRALIYQDGILVESIDLSAVTDPFVLRFDDGENYNIVTVEHGRIRFSDANCPDGSCVRQGWVGRGLIPVVCLPHRLVIELEYGSGPVFDAVVG